MARASNLSDLVLPPEYSVAGSINDRPRDSMKYEVVNDSGHENVKKAIVDGDLLTIYLPVGWSVTEVFDDAVYDGVDRGISVFGYSEVCVVSVESSEQRTCEYFTANREEYDTGEVEVAAGFRFYKPSGSCSCSHPEAIRNAGPKNPGCAYGAAQNNCAIYKAQEWKPVRIVKATMNNGDETIVTLEKNRKGYGVPVYKVTRDGEVEVELASPDLFDGVLGGYDDKEELAVNETAPRNSFLEFVLGEPADELVAG